MGKACSRESVVIAQTGAGASNAEEPNIIHNNASTYILVAILVIILGGVVYALIRGYKNFHQGWMRDEMRREVLGRIRSRLSMRSRAQVERDENGSGNQGAA